MSKKTERKLVIFNNPDKQFHEQTNLENLGDIPHPARIVIASSPNSGKTNTILNIVLNQDPPFEKIYVWHFDDESEEYDLIEHEKIYEIPSIKMIDKTVKNLVIIEDMDLKSLTKEQFSKVDRFFGYVSTHKNLSIIATCQEEFSMPPKLRRNCSHLFLWKGSEPNFLYQLDKKLKYEKGKSASLLRTHCQNSHDFLVFAYNEIPMIRKNLFEEITI